MNIIIPVGGKGERFLNAGFIEPKPLIPIFDKSMIEYVLDFVHEEIRPEEDQLTYEDQSSPVNPRTPTAAHPEFFAVYIIYNVELDRHHFSSKLVKKYPYVRFVGIETRTRGAAETLLLGIQSTQSMYNDFRKKCLILDCDTFYCSNIVEQFRNSDKNLVFYTKTLDQNPVYSYIFLNDDDKILDIKEKIRISDNANTGAYAFTDINLLRNYCEHVVDHGIVANGEPYISCVISEMLKDGYVFSGTRLSNDRVFSLGTPEAVQSYVERTHAFLFDLDGTLVITDAIYYDVWTKILSNYNIVMTDNLFAKFIQGNNDRYVLNTLLVSAGLTLNELSEWKDRLFLQNIDKIRVVYGAELTIRQIREAGHKLCVVTNCNRIIANRILKHIGLLDQFDFVLSSDDFLEKSYQIAADRYGISANRCFVFEDSKTGILCGKRFAPKVLVGIETVYTGEELLRYGVDMSMPNYGEFDISMLLNATNDPLKQIRSSLMSIPGLNIRDITIDGAKLKGGFIADVVKVRVVDIDGTTHHLIVKYECGDECQTGLSKMAKRIRMYEREYYFYESVVSSIQMTYASPPPLETLRHSYETLPTSSLRRGRPGSRLIRVPRFYGFVKDKRGDKNGIVLENMFEKKTLHRLNLNLNKESIDVSLKIVDQMAKLHSTYWGQPLKQKFPGLYSYSDELFCPFLTEFVEERRADFIARWSNVLTDRQKSISNEIFDHYDQIQNRMSRGGNLTFIHGDIKSPNIFYGPDNEPVFIDWQHCAIGKGVQDLVFFVLESFDNLNIRTVFRLMKEYYYAKLAEYGVEGYSPEEYDRDLNDALRFIPFMTAVWFGTTPQDELIDPNFPYFLITKLFYLLSE